MRRFFVIVAVCLFLFPLMAQDAKKEEPKVVLSVDKLKARTMENRARMAEIQRLIADLQKEYTQREGLDIGYLEVGTDTTLAPSKPVIKKVETTKAK